MLYEVRHTKKRGHVFITSTGFEPLTQALELKKIVRLKA